jgi:hypothetical protein
MPDSLLLTATTTSLPQRALGLVGIATMLALAWLLSSERRRIDCPAAGASSAWAR